LNNEINEEMTNLQNYSSRRRHELKKKHAYETKQQPKTLKQQESNIRKLYKHQYNTQNKQYKQYKEHILLQTPKEQQREKLLKIKEEQNRKFSFLYEHYKANVDAVYQQQNLKLTASQQHEEDQLNEDLDRQHKVLVSSHNQRKIQQFESFAKETEQLAKEKQMKQKELFEKMYKDKEELERIVSERRAKLEDCQRISLENFDDDCFNKFGVNISPYPVNSNRSKINEANSSSNPNRSLPNARPQSMANSQSSILTLASSDQFSFNNASAPQSQNVASYPHSNRLSMFVSRADYTKYASNKNQVKYAESTNNPVLSQLSQLHLDDIFTNSATSSNVTSQAPILMLAANQESHTKAVDPLLSDHFFKMNRSNRSNSMLNTKALPTNTCENSSQISNNHTNDFDNDDFNRGPPSVTSNRRNSTAFT